MTQASVNTQPLRHVEYLAQTLRVNEGRLKEYRAELIQAMREAYGPFTLEQIGEAAGLSRQRVSQLLGRAQ